MQHFVTPLLVLLSTAAALTVPSAAAAVRVPSRCAAALAAFPGAASAASVSMDFGYRLERALDPDKRGPAESDWEGDGMSAMDAMCGPSPAADAVKAADPPALTAAAAIPAAKPAASAGTAAAAAAGAVAAGVPADPASSAEPLVALNAHDVVEALRAMESLVDAISIQQ